MIIVIPHLSSRNRDSQRMLTAGDIMEMAIQNDCNIASELSNAVQFSLNPLQ